MSPTLFLLLCCLMACSAPAAALAATGPGGQSAAPQTPSPRVRVTGIVVDAATGRPIAASPWTRRRAP
jgi:hypothetical protein